MTSTERASDRVAGGRARPITALPPLQCLSSTKALSPSTPVTSILLPNFTPSTIGSAYPSQCETAISNRGWVHAEDHIPPAAITAPPPTPSIVKRQFQFRAAVIPTRQTAVLLCIPLRGSSPRRSDGLFPGWLFGERGRDDTCPPSSLSPSLSPTSDSPHTNYIK